MQSRWIQVVIALIAALVDRCRKILEALDGEPLDREFEVQGYHCDVLGVIFHSARATRLRRQGRGAGARVH